MMDVMSMMRERAERPHDSVSRAYLLKKKTKQHQIKHSWLVSIPLSRLMIHFSCFKSVCCSLSTYPAISLPCGQVGQSLVRWCIHIQSWLYRKRRYADRVADGQGSEKGKKRKKRKRPQGAPHTSCLVCVDGWVYTRCRSHSIIIMSFLRPTPFPYIS